MRGAGATPAERLLLGLLIAAILVVGGALVFGPESRLAFLFYDDAYYYLGVARHLALGDGSTFDGLNATNGYHPLWCWLLVPIFLLVDATGPGLRIVAAFWFLLAAASAVALWWALRPRTGAAGALVAAALFGLQPAGGLHFVRPNGLETPLYALLIAIFVGAWERLLGTAAGPGAGGRGSPPLRRLAGLGFLLGLVILARLDGGFLAVAAAGLLGLMGLRTWGWKPTIGALVVLTLGASAVVCPSLAWNTWRFGSPMPVSERTVQVVNAPLRAELGAPFSAPFLRRRAWYGVEAIPLQLGRAALHATPARPLLGGAGTGRALLVLGLAGGVLVAALWRRRARGALTSDALGLLAAFAALHYAAYAVWFWSGGEPGFRIYYFMPQILLMAAAVGALIGPTLERLASRAGGRRGGVAVLLGGIGLALLGSRMAVACRDGWAEAPSRPGPVAEATVYGWIRQTLPPDAILGATGAGRLGWFSGRRVVNLDGLINDERLVAAIGADRLDEYVRDSPIDYIVSSRGTLNGFDPGQPERPPAPRADVGELLHRLAVRHGLALREVSGAPGTWVAVELRRPEAGR